MPAMKKPKPTAIKPKLTGMDITLPVDGFVRQSSILAIIPICKTTLWDWVKKDKFPKPVKLNKSITAWRASDVRKWLDENQLQTVI